MYVDTSELGVGTVPMQEDDCKLEHPFLWNSADPREIIVQARKRP